MSSAKCLNVPTNKTARNIFAHLFCRRVRFTIVVTVTVLNLLRDHQSAYAEQRQATILLFPTWDPLRVSTYISRSIFPESCHDDNFYWRHCRLSLLESWHYDDSRFSARCRGFLWTILTHIPQGGLQEHGEVVCVQKYIWALKPRSS